MCMCMYDIPIYICIYIYACIYVDLEMPIVPSSRDVCWTSFFGAECPNTHNLRRGSNKPKILRHMIEKPHLPEN